MSERDAWVDAISRFTGRSGEAIQSSRPDRNSHDNNDISKTIRSQRSVTLSQISEILQLQDTKLNATLD